MNKQEKTTLFNAMLKCEYFSKKENCSDYETRTGFDKGATVLYRLMDDLGLYNEYCVYAINHQYNKPE